MPKNRFTTVSVVSLVRRAYLQKKFKINSNQFQIWQNKTYFYYWSIEKNWNVGSWYSKISQF